MRLVLTALLLSLVGCRTAPGARPAPALTPVLVRLEKGPCNARCPAWEVEVLADGALRFVGRLHTRAAGEVSAQLDAPQLAALVARLDAVDGRAWPVKADATLADAQAVALTVRGATWRYAVGSEVPEALEALVADVEARLEVAQWVTGAATR